MSMHPIVLPAWFIGSVKDKLAVRLEITESEFEKMQSGLMVMLYCDEQHKASLNRYYGSHFINDKTILQPVAFRGETYQQVILQRSLTTITKTDNI